MSPSAIRTEETSVAQPHRKQNGGEQMYNLKGSSSERLLRVSTADIAYKSQLKREIRISSLLKFITYALRKN